MAENPSPSLPPSPTSNPNPISNEEAMTETQADKLSSMAETQDKPPSMAEIQEDKLSSMAETQEDKLSSMAETQDQQLSSMAEPVHDKISAMAEENPSPSSLTTSSPNPVASSESMAETQDQHIRKRRRRPSPKPKTPKPKAQRRKVIHYKVHTKEEIEELKRQFNAALPPGVEHNYCYFCSKKSHKIDDCPRWYAIHTDVVILARPNECPMLVPKDTGKYLPPLEIPSLDDEDDVEDIKRLWKRKRKIPPARGGDCDGLCGVCYSNDHGSKDCPCLEEIPEGVKVISPQYDKACIGCGRIGLTCCSKGEYATMKQCGFCRDNGHWFWEELCTKDFRRNSRQTFNWKRIKDGKPILVRPVGVPYPSDKRDENEILRLKKRKISAPAVGDGCCEICYAKDHPYYECEWLESVPENVIIGPGFDEACIGCGKIGMRCCGVGAYAITKLCLVCLKGNHWFWEETCNFKEDSD